MDPRKPSVPVSFPIKTLEDVASRSYFDSFHYPFNVASVPLPFHAAEPPPRPRMLVCHDMMGGYKDDQWVQGGDNPEAYAIWHWYLMDVFVYFSHNLVTLPPVCWTNAAHTHGVKVLGTFILEWDEGKVIANKLLATRESAKMYAERLSELAASLGFDGWLINMEVVLGYEQIAILEEFLSHLTQIMHRSVPKSLVIWYDSVTKDGALTYQNQLNENNKPFFNLCDGILVNYSWMERDVVLSAANAGIRKFDIYMGIDVFGRGTWGGKWDINIPLDLLKKDSISACIFAPGWVYESKQKPDFSTAQNRWWGLVERSWGILKNYPRSLPFYSNFDQGRGYHFFIEGILVMDSPWNNISCQHYQPIISNSNFFTKTTFEVFIDPKGKSFNGGGNITFRGNLEDGATFKTRIFQGDLPLKDNPIHMSYSVKSEGGSLIGLSLEFVSSISGCRNSVLLAADEQACPLKDKFDRVIIPSRLNISETDREIEEGWILVHPVGSQEWILNETSIKMDGFMLTEIQIFCYMKRKDHNTKPSRKEERSSERSYLTSNGSSAFHASLGHITIRTSDQSMEFPPSTAWVTEAHNLKWATNSQGTRTVSLKLVWKLKAGFTCSFLGYNIYAVNIGKKTNGDSSERSTGNRVFIGVARVRAFYVSVHEVPSRIATVKFIIQTYGLDGTFQKLEDSPEYELAIDS